MSLGEINPKIPGFNNAGSGFGKPYYKNSEVGFFEKRLSINGAVGDGITDDAVAIQESINDCYSVTQGNLAKLIFPPGLNWYLNTSAGNMSRSVKSGTVFLDIPCTLGMDWNNAVISVGPNAATASQFLLIHGDPLYVNSADYGLSRTVYENFTLNGSTTNFGRAAILLDDKNTGTAFGPARVGFSRIFFNGCAGNGIYIVNNTYNIYAQRCEFNGMSSTGNCIYTTGGLHNSGETQTFEACQFYNSGSVLQAAYSEWNFVDCNFDYNASTAGVFNLTTATSRVTTFGCHFEFQKLNPNYPTSNGAQIVMNGSSYSQFHMVGGSIVLNPGGTGNQIGSFCDSGTTQNTANVGYISYGITLDRPYINWNGQTFTTVPLNRTTATQRFAYIP